MPSRDFYCVEIVPLIKGEDFRFRTFLTKKSLVNKKSMVVTSPELRSFLADSVYGREIKQELDNKNRPFLMGGMRGKFVPHIEHPYLMYTSFYPLDGFALKRNGESLTFEKVMRGSNIGTLVEARILRFFKEQLPFRVPVELRYSRLGMLEPRRKQLQKIRGVKNPFLYGELHADYELFKKYLKKKALERNALVDFKERAKKNKRIRFGKN